MSQKTTDPILLEAIQGLRDDIARIDHDMGGDRSRTETLAMAVSANTEQVNHFGERLELIEKKIQNRVSEAVQPLIDSTDSLQKSIEKKTFKILKQPFSWKKLFKRG